MIQGFIAAMGAYLGVAMGKRLKWSEVIPSRSQQHYFKSAPWLAVWNSIVLSPLTVKAIYTWFAAFQVNPIAKGKIHPDQKTIWIDPAVCDLLF